MKTVIDAKSVSHWYPSAQGRIHVLNDINLCLERGQVLAILGRSGCGKSTLLRIVSGLLHPSRGEIRVLGKQPEEALHDRKVGFMTQAPALFPWRSVHGNVALSTRLESRTAKRRGPSAALFAPAGRTSNALSAERSAATPRYKCAQQGR